MKPVFYAAILEADGETGYSAFFPDLPGCVGAGDSLQTTAVNATEALAMHVRGMMEDGLPLPAPTPLDALPDPFDPEVAEAARVLVPLAVPVDRPHAA